MIVTSDVTWWRKFLKWLIHGDRPDDPAPTPRSELLAARDRLQSHLASRGVETLIHYPIPPHLQSAYADLGLAEGSFPIAERIHRECLSLPIGPHIATEQVTHVIDAVRSFVP